ncbi:hypothetical protein AMS68_002709 [Peltaster fructicola]|uniref:Uncharacterized protein n=1 Tax=Peltaster fructicola TaxID=286661 RepID=A0A6H0XQZ4_9PEZI|nr:hypothetical protein AMS68_002709 [Peltaster fructicola]
MEDDQALSSDMFAFGEPTDFNQMFNIEDLFGPGELLDWAPSDEATHRFEFRPGAREEQTLAGIVAYDEDDTGDYDPAEERKRIRRANRRKQRLSIQQGEPEIDLGGSQADGDEEGDNLDDDDADTLEKVSSERTQIGRPSERPERAVQSHTTLPTSFALHRRLPAAGRAVVIRLRTKFCHPFVFNYDDFEGEDDCHFCQNPSLALVGLPPTEVVVRQLPHGRGWEELHRAGTANRIRNTKLCCMCTLRRIEIIACAHHDMRRIEKWNPMTFQQAFGALRRGDNEQTWCSICCNVARWECCTANNSQLDKTRTGCGLALCKLCTLVLDSFQGNLQRMLKEVKDECSEDRPIGLRADHILLKRNGLLMSYVTDGKGS